MTGSRILFYALGALTLCGALGVITRKSVVHSALLLIATLMGVAGIYVLFEAEFLAAVQVLVYAGGVMVLFLFVIMLVDLEMRGKAGTVPVRRSRVAIGLGVLLAALLVGTLLAFLVSQPMGPVSSSAQAFRSEGGNLGTVAMTMFRYYLLPFELASLLLLVAMVGAIVLARPRL